VALEHDCPPHRRLDPAEADKRHLGVSREAFERIARTHGRRPRMIHAADAVAKAEDFGRRIGGVAPGADFHEIASADVARLEIAEDCQRGVIRGRIGDLDRRWDRRKSESVRPDGQ
jgi:hypothetical protein